MAFIAELKRRNVIRAGIAWFAVSWLLVAMCALLFPALGLPMVALRRIIFFLLGAWIPVMFVAWRIDLTRRGQRLDQMTVVVLLAALSLSLLRQFIPLQPPAEVTAPARPVQAAVSMPRQPADPHSIAVLPFANLSPAPDDAWFADGLSEELLNVLARIEGLKVTSRTSSFVFREASVGTRDIAARLGVANLLEGSVRRQDGNVRISVQLVDAATERTRWSATYDRKLVDIFRVQEEISQSIADALAATLGVRQVQVATSTTDLQAYELFLRGRQLFVQRGANLPAARELLERAVERDAQFADAWAALAGTWYVWRSYANEPEGVSTLEQAGIAASKALALDPRHPGALAVSARLAADAGDRLRHAELIEQSLALEPNNANTWLWQGLGLFEVGHLKAAHASFEQAQRLDPLSGLQLGWLGITTALRGDPVAGAQRLQQAHALGWRGPASRALFLLALDAGEASAPAFRVWMHDDDGMPASQRELALSLAVALEDPARLGDVQQRLLAAAYAEPGLEWSALLQVFGLGDAAVSMSLRTEPARTQPLLFSLWYPTMRSFREHPGFLEFAERHGLAAYWRENGKPDGCALPSAAVPHLQCDR